MSTLVSRDTTGTFSVREGEIRELVSERTAAFKVFECPPDPETGAQRRRCGGGVGKVHWKLDPDREDEEYKEIDLTIREYGGRPWDWACITNGYQVGIAQRLPYAGQRLHYVAQFRRLGAWLRMAPVGLLWENDVGQRQLIARPTGGIEPEIDNNAYRVTWRDAFGPGLHFRYNVNPDEFFKTLVVERRDALPRPTIARKGLRLTIVMAWAWSGEAGPEEFAAGEEVNEFDEGVDPDGEADEEVEDPGPYPYVRAADGRIAFWIREPRAWDSWEPDEEAEQPEQAPHRWPVRMRLRRRGGQVFARLSLDARALKQAVYPVFVDTDISEEQVGASKDDGWSWLYLGTWYHYYTNSTSYTNYSIGTTVYNFARFTTVPIPSGAVIDSATIAYYCSHSIDDLPNTALHCEDADSAGDLDSSDIEDRSLTANSTAWVVGGGGTGTGWVTADDMSDAVQDVIDRGGWASNNALAVIAYDATTPSKFVHNTYEASGNDKGAKLNVAYTAGGGGEVLDLAVAEVTVSGVAGSLSAPPSLSAAVAEVVGTGQGATLPGPGALSAALGEVTVEGVAGEMMTPAALAAAVAEVVGTGQGATLPGPGALSAGLGEVTVEGVAGEMMTPAALSAAVAEVVCEGLGTTPRTPGALAAAVSEVAVEGVAGEAISPGALEAAVAEVVAAGIAVGTVAPGALELVVGEVAVEGTAVELGVIGTLEAAVAEIRATGLPITAIEVLQAAVAEVTVEGMPVGVWARVCPPLHVADLERVGLTVGDLERVGVQVREVERHELRTTSIIRHRLRVLELLRRILHVDLD